MLAAFLLGLFGSFGHCAGMCGGVAVLLSRRAEAGGWRVVLLHLGRLSSYTLLGALTGGLGFALSGVLAGGARGQSNALPPSLARAQGLLALVAAAAALYMAVALLGRAPSPERLLQGLVRRWGQAMRRHSSAPAPTHGALRPLLSLYGLGLLWGLLPCGLVWAGLLMAVASGSPLRGAGMMLAFGSGTLFLGLAMSLLGRWQGNRLALLPWVRSAAAALVLLVGVQMALRGLAAWGWVAHQHLGGVMLW